LHDMDSAKKNLLRSTSRELLRDFDSPSNDLTLRQLLDKHAVKCGLMITQLGTPGNGGRK
ncbi:hypothetical protein, partial [Serratia marcescens]|uniref:hypothetical protein n=1 Tax=Serratia marcescens TaxID=615 RepID=UPI002FDB0979